MKATKIVHGVTMEQRRCACECKLPFWVKESSPQKFRSKFCSADFQWGNYAQDGETPRKVGRKPFVPPPGRVTTKQLMEELDVSQFCVNKWVTAQVIPHERQGRDLHYSVAEVRAALKARAELAHPNARVYRP